jgi:hypothetical protein
VGNSQDVANIQAARALVSAEWYMYPGYIGPGGWLSSAASPEEIRRAYRKLGAAFTVDVEGVLSLRLSLDLEEVGKSLREKSIFWGAAIP